jgi:hypothetical protein
MAVGALNAEGKRKDYKSGDSRDGDRTHHFGTLLGGLLRTLGRLENTLGLIERGLNAGNLRLGTLDCF